MPFLDSGTACFSDAVPCDSQAHDNSMHVNAVPSHATRRSFRSSRFVFVRTDLGKSKRYQSLWRVKLSIRGWHALKFALPFLVSWSCALLSNQLSRSSPLPVGRRSVSLLAATRSSNCRWHLSRRGIARILFPSFGFRQEVKHRLLLTLDFVADNLQ